MNYDLNRLHRTLIEILDFVVEICEQNDLQYCLLYGTALGAYRHKGFIPWDDDLDIGMPRADYEKFIQIMKCRPSTNFDLQNEWNEEKWFLTFSKIRKNGTCFIESIVDGLYKNNGIYIDIFPLDFVNKNNANIAIKRKYINYLKHTLKIQACPKLFLEKEGRLKYTVDRFLSFPSYFLNDKVLVRYVNNLMISKNKKNNDYCFVAQYDESSDAAIMEKEIYFPLRKCSFEGKEYYVPGNIEEYLRRQYGNDFMELPPIEKRMTHKPIKVEF